MIRLAWRNIWRNKRRTVLTLLAVAFSSAILVFFMSLQLSSYEASINASMSVFQGHLQVQHQGYAEKPQMRDDISPLAALRTELQSIPGVKALSPRALAFALVASDSRTYGAQIVGVDPEHEGKVSTIPGLVRSGRPLSSMQAYEAIMGKTLATNLRIKIGDEVTLLGQGKSGSLASIVLPVVGFFESGVNELDRNVLEMPLGAFQEVFEMEDAGHSIVIVGSALEIVPQIQAEVRSILKRGGRDSRLTVLTWDELTPGLRQAIDLDMTFGWLFYFSLIIIVGFSILNTFLMSVLERTREFGIMLALGTKPMRISRLILIESMLLTVFGLCFGILIGSCFVLYYGTYGFQIPGSDEVMKIWGLTGMIWPKLTIASALIGPLVTLCMSFLAVLYPALRIWKLEPVEAMRAI